MGNFLASFKFCSLSVLNFRIQDELKRKLITEDDFPWEIPSSSSSVDFGDGGERKEGLKYVGGVDISFLKEDPSIACGTLVVLELDSLNVVYDDFSVDMLHIPYVPGFLAFREVCVRALMIVGLVFNECITYDRF